MSDKEATVYIVDISRSMGKAHQNRPLSDLDWSLQWVWDKITTTVSTGRKTAMVGVVALGSNATNNNMENEAGYEHISVVTKISQILMPELRAMPDALKASNTDNRDALSGVIIGVDMIMQHCRHLKYKKKIVLVTNGTGNMDDDDIENTAAEIKKNDIELVVLGVDFDDAEFGFKEEDKHPIKAKNEASLRRLVELSSGMFGTMQEAIQGLSRPEVKLPRPVPTYRGRLCLGDPEHYDTALTIDIERYFKTFVARAPTASSFAIRPENTSSQDLGAIHNEFSYTVKDDSETTGVIHLKREDLAKGYEYGRTAVHISSADENITKLETHQNYEIMGFVPADNVERYMLIENSTLLVAQKANDKAALALSSLIHALFELGSVAVARVVKKDMSTPEVTLLSPLVEPEFEALVENTLPFAEDIRTYRFPPLDKVLTVSGKAITSHRNLPNDDLLNAMSDYVDSMNLVSGSGEEGEEVEEMPMDDTFSPVLHTIKAAIKYRAVHPDAPVPDKPEAFLSYSRIPDHVANRSKDPLRRLIKAADVKKVPPKAKGRRKYRDTEKPLSGLDVDALFRSTSNKRVKIDPKNAIPEFKRMLDMPDNMDTVRDAVSQMAVIIEEDVRESFGDKHYAHAIEAMATLREEMVGLEEAKMYNDFLKGFKRKLVEGELGGERREFWFMVRRAQVGLISNEVFEHSDVSREEAEVFMVLGQ
jgi:ATP-dependent DNA helicase 2 subunit 2